MSVKTLPVESPRVLLVEDHPLLQQAMLLLLSRHCTVVAALDRSEHIPHTIRTTRPDVLVLDVSLPDRSGLQVLPELRSSFPDLGIVIATNHTQPIYRAEAFDRGAHAFVAKGGLQEDLWPAIQHALHACQREGPSRRNKQA